MEEVFNKSSGVGNGNGNGNGNIAGKKRKQRFCALFAAIAIVSTSYWRLHRAVVFAANGTEKEEESSQVWVGQQQQQQQQLRQQRQRQRQLLTCYDVVRLEIIRRAGTGGNKMAFEVRLPDEYGGGIAIAKRVHSTKPRYQGLLKKETRLLRELQDQYGPGRTLGFYGDCQATDDSVLVEQLKKLGTGTGTNMNADTNATAIESVLRNFSVGYTSVVEMGRPLLADGQLSGGGAGRVCRMPGRQCFGSFLTEADRADLVDVARMYANFSGGPLTLRSVRRDRSDNCKAEQYVVTTGGFLRHADLEMVYGAPFGQNCTYGEALEANCSVLRVLLNDTGLDCGAGAGAAAAEEPSSSATKTTLQLPNKNRRINITEAVNYCSALHENANKE